MDPEETKTIEHMKTSENFLTFVTPFRFLIVGDSGATITACVPKTSSDFFSSLLPLVEFNSIRVC